MIFNLGTTVPLSWSNGVPLGTATLTVTDPAGVTHIQSVPDSGGGVYNATYTPAIFGLFTVLWGASLGGISGSFQDVFEVRPASPQALVSLEDVIDTLNLRSTDNTDYNKIQRLIEAASNIVIDLTDQVQYTTYTQWFDGGVGTISPLHKPIVSVLSASEYYGISEFVLTEQPLGFQTDAFAFTVDYSTGQITRRTYGGAAAQFAIGSKNVRFTYVAGLQYVPENVQVATLELVRHFYVNTQIPAGRGGRSSSMEELGAVNIGYAVPNFVIEMLQPNRRAPGIA